MKVNDIRKGDTLVVRILAQTEEYGYVIDCERCRMPFLMDAASLEAMVPVDEEVYKPFYTDEELSPRQIDIRNERFEVISPVVAPYYAANKDERNQMIRDIAKQSGLCRRTIVQYLWRYWVAQSKNALIPQNANLQNKPLTADQKNFRWALNRWYYSGKRQTLKQTYRLLLKDKYCDEFGTLSETYPTFNQFRYFFRKTRSTTKELISREGLKKYQRQHRPIVGNVREYAGNIGSYMVDATIADVHIVSRLSRKVIGRPVVYAMVDAFSSMVCGVYVGLEGGQNALRLLMANTLMDKADFCKEYDIEILPEEWDCHHLPTRIITDRGTEFTAGVLENICEDFSIEIVNLPSYRPDEKSIVEQLFHMIQSAYLSQLQKKGAIEADFQERGAADYRRGAALDIIQFTQIVIRTVLYYNNHHIRVAYPRTPAQIEKDIPPIASRIWAHALSEPECPVQVVDTKRFLLALLPRAQAGFTRRGLEVFGIHYMHSDYRNRFVEAGVRGKELVTVAYNPESLSRVWLYENQQYVAFDVSMERYKGLSLDELMHHQKNEKQLVKSLEHDALQARIHLIADIEDVTAQALPTTQQSIREISTGVRENRTQEKEHFQTAFSRIMDGVDNDDS